ncbi:GNAT family N-acetyltransferase [Komagataeibacter sp. FNDCR2]|uniref:GNAT family N-acetyltransferase n=1 Tax=Komagataeibacter sp. FNDCR2 TaxID=2878682 RepID=UPI001E445831|nr:GNAT family N-acetyltransferase [Komagataeibacter sp. FNDCR2]MCE2575952.1 GNAT family N-acetyltransferase [Komagataeibacter sp. FNDCR2]
MTHSDHPVAPMAAPIHGRWRPMEARDLPAVSALAERLHPACPERPAILEERHSLCPPGCLILPGPTGGVGGYVLSHPWRMASPPALDTYLRRLPEAADCWYLHDIAILPSLRGRGDTHAALGLMAAQARRQGISWLALMAAEGARAVWAHLGFTPMADIPPQVTRSYGADACPMRRAISPAP